MDNESISQVIEAQKGSIIRQVVQITRLEQHHHAGTAGVPLTPREQSELERRYLDQVANECRYLWTEGLEDEFVHLSDVFIPLKATQRHDRKQAGDSSRPPSDEPGLQEIAEQESQSPHSRQPDQSLQSLFPPVSLSQVLKQHHHVVILGEPGSGKTTTIRFVALRLAEGGCAETGLGLGEPWVPVLGELQDYDGERPLGDFLVDLIAFTGQFDPADGQASRRKARSLLQAWFDEGRLAVLLDALDEVPEEKRTKVADQIWRFASSPEGQQCRVVVTSRIAGYREAWGNPVHYTIQPFAGSEDEQAFVEGWLKALGRNEERAKEEAGHLLTAMADQDGLRRVIKNPLLLRLAVSVYIETGDVGFHRAELYRRYVEDVAWRRAQRRKRASWSWNQVGLALENVAWALQSQDGLTLHELTDVIVESRSTEPQQIPPIEDGAALLDYLREQLGLLTIGGHEGKRRVIFYHPTFREYFVARRLYLAWRKGKAYQERTWRFLKPRLHHSNWREPVLLLAGMLDSVEATAFVQRVLEARSPYERQLHRDLLLAGAIIGDRVPIQQEVMANVTRSLVRLLWRSRQPQKAADVLTSFGEWAVEPLNAVVMREKKWEEVEETVDKLGLIGRVPVLLFQLIMGAFAGDRWKAAATAARTLGQIGGSEAVAQLVSMSDLKLATKYHRFSAEVRAAIANALGAAGGERGVKWLIQLLEDEYRWVGKSAFKALVLIGDERVTTALERFLEVYPYEAAGALAECGEAATDLLARAVRGERIIYHFVKVFGRSGAPVAERLIKMLEDEDTRENAGFALRRMGHSAVEPLVRALGGRNVEVRREAAQALRFIIDKAHTSAYAVEPLLNALKDESEAVRFNAEGALAEIRDAGAVELLLRAMDDEQENMRRAAARALRKIGDARAIEPLAKALGDEKDVCWVAAEALVRIGGAGVVEALLHRLEEKNLQVCLMAAWVLGRIGATQAVDWSHYSLDFEESENDVVISVAAANLMGFFGVRLVELLWDENINMRFVEAWVLGGIGQAQAVEPLVRALRDENEDVRFLAAMVLGIPGDELAVEPLMGALNDDSWTVRAAAAKALGMVGSRQAVRPLIRALEDDYSYIHGREVFPVAKAAARALGEIGDLRAVEPLIRGMRKWGKVVSLPTSQEAMEALRKIGKPAIKPLMRAIEDNDDHIAHGVLVEALGEIGEPAIESLVGMLGSDPMRFDAITALVKIDEPAVGPLMRTLKGESWLARQSAAKALGEIGEPAIEPLIRMLTDGDRQTKVAAMEALREIGEPAMESLATASNGDLGIAWASIDGRYLGAKEVAVGLLDELAARLTNLRILHRAAMLCRGYRAYGTLDKVVEQMTKLQVAELPMVDPLTALPSKDSIFRALRFAIISVLPAFLSGLTMEIIGPWLQEQYGLTSSTWRFAFVAMVFVLTLVVMIWAEMRKGLPSAAE